jgi:serine/threonine protein kinase
MTYSTIGPYRLLKKLGEGGMGVVYEAVHQGIGHHVAIKLLAPQFNSQSEYVSRFLNEARAAAAIDHPGIVQVIDSGRLQDGSTYLIMELLKGESLAARVQSGEQPLFHVLYIGWQIASALAAAHTAGIVHRDLKPHNVMLIPDPMVLTGERVKILDFGIAKLAHAGHDATRSNVIMGTPRYMSPEQCRGAARVDDKSDVYSLGVILFEMLAGRPLFEPETPNGYLFLHVIEPPPRLRTVAPEVPEQVAALVQQLLAKQPDARPTMQQVAARLRTLSEPSPHLHGAASQLAPLAPLPPSSPPSSTPAVVVPLPAQPETVVRVPPRPALRRTGFALGGGVLGGVIVLLLLPWSARFPGRHRVGLATATSQPRQSPSPPAPVPKPPAVAPSPEVIFRPLPTPASLPTPVPAAASTRNEAVIARAATAQIVPTEDPVREAEGKPRRPARAEAKRASSASKRPTEPVVSELPKPAGATDESLFGS